MARLWSKKKRTPKKPARKEEESREEHLSSGPLGSEKNILSLQRSAGNKAVTGLMKATKESEPLVSNTSPPVVQEALRSPGKPIDPSTRQQMESHFSEDFSQVRIHISEQAERAALSVGAKAFTVGEDIFFREENYQPGTNRGKELLAHELAHVTQQSRPPGNSDTHTNLEAEAHEAGARSVANQPMRIQGAASIAVQRAPEEKYKLPPAVVTAQSADVFDKPDPKAIKQDTLKQYHVIAQVVEKKKVGDTWWYKIRYKIGKTEKTGWSLGENFSEVAFPESFQFQTPGATSFTTPFEDLRKAVSKGNLQPGIARLINLMNLVVLPSPNVTLPGFVGQSFFQALVEAKGNFKQACLLMTAAVRAFKPSSGGNFPWVQANKTASTQFDPATFRDKIWHFFWNAYERFDGASFAWLDFKGVAYELKSRSEPVKKFVKGEPLGRDATEDVVFNRGGIRFAEWIMNNQTAIIKHHYSEMEKVFREIIAKDPEISKLPDDKKDELITKMLQSAEVETELKKRNYTEFAEYAAKHVELVLDTIKTKVP